MTTTPIRRRLQGHPYRNIFVAMLTVVFVDALAPELVGGLWVANLLMAGLILAALVETVRERRNAVVALVLGLPAVIARLVAPALPDTSAVNSAVLVLNAVFFGYLIWNIVRDITSGNRPARERIFGALCAYVFIGVVFALLYAHLQYRNPGSATFSASNSGIIDAAATESGLLPMFMYFSFVTLTTLGYGDITPVSDAARTLAWMEALIGQLYLVVMVAGLVAAHMAEQQQPDRKENPPGSDAEDI